MAEKKRRQYGTGSVHQRKSDGRWIGVVEAGWTAAGTRRRITVSAKTEAEAGRRLRDRQRKINAEGLPAQGVGRATVKTWAEAWLDMQVRNVRPKAFATDRTAVTRWIVPTIGHRRLEELTPADVRAVSTAALKAGRSSSTAHRYHVVLTKMLRDALREGHDVHRRVLEVRPPTKAASDREDIDLADAIALLQAANATPGGSRWVAALLQGMRQGECLGLTWDAVDLDAGSIDVSWQLQPLPYADRESDTFRVPTGHESRRLVGAFHLVRPKTARGQRLVPIVPWMEAALRQWRQIAPENPWGLVWPATRRDASGREAVLPQVDNADRADWYRLQDAVQVARVDGTQGRRYLLHEARHTTATLLLAAGVDQKIIEDIMGHSIIVSRAAYQHVSLDMARQALQAVAGQLQLEG